MNLLADYTVQKRPTGKWGLLYEFSIEPPYKDDSDWAEPILACRPTEMTPFSSCNREVLKQFVEPWVRSIVEIGVSRDGYDTSSTKVFLENKHPDCTYLGIDVEDRSFILNKSTHVRFLQNSSWDVETNMGVFRQTGQQQIDLLFIDGDHSVKSVLREWDYVQYLNPNGGIVVLHDTNFHPGPWCLLQAVDPNLFSVERYCENYNDYGIAVLRRK